MVRWFPYVVLAAILSACSESTFTDTLPVKSWEDPVLVELISDSASEGGAVLYDSGDAIVIWTAHLGYELSHTRISRFNPDTGWSETATLSDASAWSFSPALASGSPETAVATWLSVKRAVSDGQQVYASTYSAASGWSPETLLSIPGEHTNRPTIAGLVDGGVIVAWEQVEPPGYEDVYQARFQPGVGWEASTPIEDADKSIRLPTVVSNSAGDSFAFWFRDNWPSEYELVAAAHRPSTGWGAVTAMVSLDSPITYFDVASSPGEGATAVFAQNNGMYVDVFAADYSIADGWSTPLSIGGDDPSPRGVAIAIAGNEDAFVAWLRRTGPNTLDPNEVVVSRRISGGEWGTPTVVTAMPGSASFVTLAANNRGGAIVAWLQHDGETDSVFAATFDPATGWGDPQVIEEENGDASRWFEAYAPRVAMNANGDAIVVWTQYDGVTHSVFAASYR